MTKVAPRPPPDRRKAPENVELENEDKINKKPRRVIRRKSKSDSNNRRRVTRTSKKSEDSETVESNNPIEEDDYDEALRRLTGSGLEDES